MTSQLAEVLKEQKKTTKRKNLPLVGTLGIPLDGQRVVEVAGRKSFVYVKLRDNQNEVIQAFNNKVAASYGLPVILARKNGRYVVLDVDTIRYQNNWNSFAPFLPIHGNTHSFDPDNSGGGDVVWIHPRQIMPSLIIPSGSTGAPNVLMSSYTLQTPDRNWKYTGNTGTANLTPYKPNSTGTTLVLVYLDVTTGNPGFIFATGTYINPSITGTAQLVPYFPTLTEPANRIPLSVVRLVSGTSTIGWDNIYDVRQWIHPIVTGSAGGGGNFDSTYLRLDTTNNPLTGGLEIRPTSGLVNGLLIVQETEGTTPFVINHTASPSGTMGNSFRFNRTEDWGNETIIGPAIQVYQTWNLVRVTPNSGGFLSFYSNDILRTSIDPSANGTGTMTMFDGDFSLDDDGNLLLLKTNGVPKTKIAGLGNLEFGLDVVTKEPNAGKIGYQLFDDYLDIVGAGTSSNNRTVKIYDHLIVSSNATVGSLTIPGIVSQLVTTNAGGTFSGAENYTPSGTYGRKDYGWASVTPEDGWIFVSESWTRTGNHSFAIIGQGDLSSRYRKGTKLRYNDPVLEYGVVGSVHVTGSNTYINMIPNSDYAMANATILARYVSYIENPDGFPHWFNYAPTYDASGSMTFTSVSTTAAFWDVKGETITVFVNAVGTTGGTASNTLRASAPITETTAMYGAGTTRDATSGNVVLAICFVSTGLLQVRKSDSTNYGLGTGRIMALTVSYQF